MFFVGVMLFAFRDRVAANLLGTSLDKRGAFPRAGSPRSVAAFGGVIAMIGLVMLVLDIALQS
jgi:hypothetical protein